MSAAGVVVLVLVVAGAVALRAAVAWVEARDHGRHS